MLELTLWSECERWTAEALAVENREADPSQSLALVLAHGQALLLLERHGPKVRDAFLDAANLAKRLGQPLLESRALLGLHRYFGRNEDYAETLIIANRMRDIAVTAGLGEAAILADLALGISQHFLGQQDLACLNMARGLQRAPRTSQMSTWLSVGSATIPTTICLARSLWLHGLPDQAMAKARECREHAEQLRLAGGPGDAATWVIQVYFWTGDWASAEEMTDDLQALDSHDSESQSHGLAPALRGELATRRGDAAFGVPLLRERLERLRAAGRYSLMPTIAYVEGLIALAQLDEAAETLEHAIELSKAHSHLLYMPELLRLKGEIAAERDTRLAEALYEDACDLARRQSARSWELRAMTSLTRLRLRGRHGSETLSSLAAVVGAFTEGIGTRDLIAARQLIEAHPRFA
jgi:tetratricopeptide (TPR) repeat protein